LIAPPTPADEPQRQERLAALHVLDSDAEPTFDNIARLAAHLAGTPIALVTLVDTNRQWFKAKVGLTASEGPRDQSFCAHALDSRHPLVIPDARLDPRFRENPVVKGDSSIRFYAGFPLRVGAGSALGTLCVLDRVPRQLTSAQIEGLRMLADQVAIELQLRAELRRQGRPPEPAVEVPTVERETMFLPQAAREPSNPTPRGSGSSGDLPVATGVRLEDRYQIDEAIGRGGMGYVFAARDLKENRSVAIKFLRADPARHDEAIVRFAREARAVMGIGSQHVTRIYDVGNTDLGVPYIVMERLKGEELGTRIARQGRLPAGFAVQLALQACEVLGEAHDAGIVHRDIKPSNLFLVAAADGRSEDVPLLKVLDFGIAKFAPSASGDQDITSTGAFMLGTPHYMAPEQVLGEAEIDGRADIWSLGVVLYEMLTGKLPFPGDSVFSVTNAVLAAPPPRLPSDTPAGFSPVLDRCLGKLRPDRYGSVWELARDLSILR
jgi:hypothetical protein